MPLAFQVRFGRTRHWQQLCIRQHANIAARLDESSPGITDMLAENADA
jgi:hypothetical protein